MKKTDRISVLKEKHQELHLLIEAAEAENAPDEWVQRKKKEKLAIKDEIESIYRSISEQL
tara:strand:+ start:719 stop:898 length:180 start_codon:yes stop_codon:yes gene_type:complete